MAINILLLRLENLKFSSNKVAFESGQEVFEIIGKPRYYNIHDSEWNNIKIPTQTIEHRLGKHKEGETKRIDHMNSSCTK